jgi:hypothetical protein
MPTSDSEGDVCVGDVLAFAYLVYNDQKGKGKKYPHLELHFGQVKSISALDPKYRKDTRMQVTKCLGGLELVIDGIFLSMIFHY